MFAPLKNNNLSGICLFSATNLFKMEECLETLCRICLQSAEHEDLTEITSMECEIAQKLNQISGIIVNMFVYILFQL